ncbi:PREDICTED: mitotic interactor and substrate of PLK1 [Hipposideros armiger]|uniref:Mitotic interactor and substrate of PLK1 n=1 Tax=Hipposideros armiger TaxID=186990 RepID=A0A8B7SHD2_HIPAR|nr:PREDICTED: mitotic interactor and substrate of PLK1 [Hipposideros armiger]XP_019512746.1 PREDICTED: mitotic interactor and substrate of PLK1 [Hipposideros armiger]
MDRVTRYPIFSIPDSPGVASLALNGDTGYMFELVDVEPSASGWGQDQPQAWTTDYKAQLDVVRTGVPCSLRAVPSQLFLRQEDHEDEEVKAYQLDTRDASPRWPRDLQWEHWVVIQNQAVRKSGTVATLHGTPGHRDTRTSGRPQSMPLEENVINREQIDFLAARQQFLSLEKANAGIPQNPQARVAPTCAPPRISQAPKALNGLSLANGYVVSVQPQVKEKKRVHGLSKASGIQAVDDPGSQSPAESLEVPKETPIEREIRLVQEREAALRKQRGLQRADNHQELVEIPTRPLLTKVSLTAAPRRDRGRPSLYVQRDMVQETQREEDHRREGLQVGRASTPDWALEDPRPGLRRAFSSDSILGLAPDASAADPAPDVRKVNRIPPAAYLPYLSPGTPQQESPALRAYSKPSGLSADEGKAVASPKATGSQRLVSATSGKPSGTKQESWKPPRGPLQANGGVVRWEYFRLRPPLFRVPDVPQKAEPPGIWGWEVARAPALRLQKSQSSELLEREVESVLRREREVAEERRNALFPEVSPPLEEGCDQDSRSSSQASGIMGSYSVSESHYFAPIYLHSGPVWTAEGPAEAAPEQRKKKEQWYAGINPLDHVNSEVLEATRVTRHKNAMAERWEAGVYASENED